MDTTGNLQIQAKLKELLPDAWCMYVYGSQAAGNETTESDLDIALLGPQEYPVVELFEIEMTVVQMASREVDLVDLRSVPTDLQSQIVSKGVRIGWAEPGQVEAFEAFVYSSYARLNEERRHILKDIEKRGSIYGG